MTSPFDAFDRAVDDLSWRFGAAESELGVAAQATEGALDALVFDDAAQWRKMEVMCSSRRMTAVQRMRIVDAAMRQCPEHVGTFRLAFVPFGRASAPVIDAFTSGRVVLLGLAMASPTALDAFEKAKSGSLVDWLDELSKNIKSRPIFERMRISAQTRLLPALTAYDAAVVQVRADAQKAKREANERRLREIRDEAAKSRPNEAPEVRSQRLLKDTLRVMREAGYE